MDQPPKKSKMVSMRLTPDQFELIDGIARRIYESTGFRITRASIMQRLMSYGLPHLEKEVPAAKAKAG